MHTRTLGTSGLEVSAIGLVPFSPLGKGFLTGTIDSTTRFPDGDLRNNLPRFTEEARAANQALVGIAGVAARLDVTPAQVALAVMGLLFVKWAGRSGTRDGFLGAASGWPAGQVVARVFRRTVRL